MLRLALYTNKSFPNLNLTGSNPNDAIFINNNGGASCFANFINTNVGAQSCNIGWTQGSQWINNARQELNSVFCTQVNSLYPCICFTWDNANEKADLENWLFSSSFNLRIIPRVVIAGVVHYVKAFDVPYVGNSATLINNGKRDYYLLETNVSNCFNPSYITELSEIGAFPCTNAFDGFTITASDKTNGINNTLQFTSYNNNPFPSSPADCDDVRSSSSTSEFLITLNGVNVVDEQDSVSYNMLIQPDSSHTSGEITLSNTDNLYSSFKKYIGASVRMLDNVCCHGAGYIEIYGDVHIEGFGISEVSDIYLPVYRSLIRENVLFLRANFDDECCCFATGYADEVSDLVNQFMDGYSSYDSHSEIISAFTPKKIRWVGFERLVDFCCDDSDCTEINPHDYDIEIPSSGGGGSDVDISCICDGLTSLTTMLSSKLDSLVSGQGSIVEALDGLDISIDNDCICDNLGTINDSLEAIKESIDDKELSVTNSPQITVQPCTPVVTNPVNNITVEPCTPNITVEPCTPNITVEPCTPNITVEPCTPNITVEPCTPNINVQPCQPTVQNVINEGDVNIDNDDLIEKLDELFKSDDKTITDVIKDKEMGTNIDVEVSPADDVNVNRVYYTNQRNGDTNI